jgi:hypothetical protein
MERLRVEDGKVMSTLRVQFETRCESRNDPLFISGRCEQRVE